MPLYPNNRRDMFGYTPMRGVGLPHIHASVPRVWLRSNFFVRAESAKTASFPDGYAPHGVMFLPVTAGGMTASPVAGITMTASLLQGGPMDATWTAGATMNQPTMGLIVAMDATWTAAMTANTPDMALTLGMDATWTAGLTATASLAMVVPLGTASWAAGMTATADLKGNLSMSAEFGGAEPLSPQGLAAAVWEALATDYDAAMTMGEKLNLAGSGGVDYAALAAAVLAAAQATPIHSDIRKVNNYTVTGTGQTGTEWGPA